jgi:hypothetical protein
VSSPERTRRSAPRSSSTGGDNYKTQYDDEDEASGQSYGVTTEPNDDPLPGEPPAAAEESAKGSSQLADDEDFDVF